MKNYLTQTNKMYWSDEAGIIWAYVWGTELFYRDGKWHEKETSK